MKFGRNLQRNQVPQWAAQYINYKELKKLIKSAAEQSRYGSDVDLADFFFKLNRNLETVDGFYNRTYFDLSRRLRLLYDRYGEDAPNQHSSQQHELSDVVNALLDLRVHFRNLQWYGEVNKRGFTKILKKLDKKVPDASYQQKYLSSQIEPKAFATNYALAQDMNSINGWLSKVSDVKPASEASSNRSSFSMPRPLQSTLANISPTVVSSVDDALMDDDVGDLRVALEELGIAVKDQETLSKLMLQALQRALQYSALSCIPIVLQHVDSLADTEDFHQRNCLHRLLINVGRARASKAGHASVTDSPDIDALDRIAPAEAPALDLNPFGIREEESSRSKAGADNTPQLVTAVLEHFSDSQRSALQARDDFGRLPLHYAAKYGFVNVCQIIMEKMLSWGQINASAGFASIAWQDSDGSTPLHLAVIGGWRLTVETLLVLFRQIPGLDTQFPLKGWPASSQLLALGTRANFPLIVGMLIDAGAETNQQDDEGETPLHVAARFGHVQCAEALMNCQKHHKLELNIAEKTYGWTPLLIAAVDGRYGMVEFLIKAGADLDRIDESGWTAKEHAALRGHMRIAELLAEHTPIILPQKSDSKPILNEIGRGKSAIGERGSVKENPARTAPPIKAYGHRYLQEDSMVLVSLGSMDARKKVKPIDLESIPLAEAHATQLDTALSIIISARGAVGDPYTVDLPTEENISTEPFSFTTKDVSKVKLFFDIVPTYAGSHEEKVGRGVAMLQNVRPNMGTKRISLQGDISVPILGTKSMEVIGMVNFNFLIVKPFKHKNIVISETSTYWRSLTMPMVIGHRGLGKNMASRKSLQLGENTIQSFIAASNLGATYVEFDVQLTKDHVPVVYHDFLVSETGIDAPVHTLTLEQFLHVSETISGGSRASTPPHEATRAAESSSDPFKRRTQRSNSLGALSQKDHRVEMAERMKHTLDFKRDGFKPNSRGDFIQAPFATLAQMFRELPESIGFNIEMKYPMLLESEQFEMDTYAVELNEFVDTVLKMVYDFVGRRNVIFSSFHPDMCLLLSLKQPNIPILFLTEAGTYPVSDVRASSLQEAIRFASRWNLLGLVSAAEPLVMCPRLVRVVKESGLVCVSYGALNNDPKHVEKQVDQGIDAVIVDNVLAVRKGLTAAAGEKAAAAAAAATNAATSNGGPLSGHFNSKLQRPTTNGVAV